MKVKKFSGICVWIIASLLPDFCEATFSTLEDEYTPTYCLQLEAAYGEGMMSEGGVKGIEHMFDQIPLEGKKALDIGCGLGGVVFYLAEKYKVDVTGLEVNKWMVAESEKRTPDFLKNRVNFLLSTSNNKWPISQESYDLIYSKGVLTHLEVKDGVFQQCHRLLKNEGLLVITDWLSSDHKKWGKNIEKLVELEHLALFPETEAGYIELLEKNGFTILSVRDDSYVYLGFNQKIIERLQNPEQLGRYVNCFNENELEASIDGYKSIAKAIEEGELKVLRFVAQKRIN
ncbi:MAG: methyltransferase domain-containing protein [Rhabdochlamydiaceae bacterium]|nr:methyltransferase domain-containing protein [Rhabdochlamydiaceae bacterium]